MGNGLALRIITLPLYPTIVGLIFVANLSASNLPFFSFQAALEAVLVVVALTVGMTWIFCLILRGKPHRAAVVSLLYCLILFFPDDWAARGVHGLDSWQIALIAVGAFVVFIALLRLSSAMQGRLTMIVNASALTMLLVPFITLDLRAAEPKPIDVDIAAGNAIDPDAINLARGGAKVLPNIVHVVLDGYAGRDVQNDYFGRSTEFFYDALRERGFLIAERSWSPYDKTLFSMAATLQGDYHRLGSQTKDDRRNRRGEIDNHVRSILGFGPIREVLKPAGYQFFATEPGLHNYFDFADEVRVFRPRGHEQFRLMELYYISQSRLRLIKPLLDLARNWFNHGLNTATRESFNVVERLPENKTGMPFHLYLHVIAPHPPFSMNENGEDDFVTSPNFQSWATVIILNEKNIIAEYKNGYNALCSFLEKRTISLFDDIKRVVDGPLIMIIQSDHGAVISADTPGGIRKSRALFQNFFAIYSDSDVVRQHFSTRFRKDYNTVNIYRDVFKAAFSVPLPPLASRLLLVDREITD